MVGEARIVGSWQARMAACAARSPLLALQASSARPARAMRLMCHARARRSRRCRRFGHGARRTGDAGLVHARQSMRDGACAAEHARLCMRGRAYA
jgi:hypothetical protein